MINQFIQANNIRPADAIVVQKQKFGILDHYVIYLGVGGDGEHKFIANYSNGIRFLSYLLIFQYLRSYSPISINRFNGDDTQRQLAVSRALSRLNEDSYHLILNNCEHFKNYVQYGIEKSEQVEDFGKALAIGGIGLAVTGAATKNDRIATVGLFSAVLGLIAIGLSER